MPTYACCMALTEEASARPVSEASDRRARQLADGLASASARTRLVSQAQRLETLAQEMASGVSQASAIPASDMIA